MLLLPVLCFLVPLTTAVPHKRNAENDGVTVKKVVSMTTEKIVCDENGKCVKEVCKNGECTETEGLQPDLIGGSSLGGLFDGLLGGSSGGSGLSDLFDLGSLTGVLDGLPDSFSSLLAGNLGNAQTLTGSSGEWELVDAEGDLTSLLDRLDSFDKMAGLDTGVTHKLKCEEGIDKCRVCIDGICSKSGEGIAKYSQVMKTTGCATAVCGDDCEGFVMVKEADGKMCPVCKCDGFGTREPCDTSKDCMSKECVDGLCRVEQPEGSPAQICLFDNQCDSPSDSCIAGVCQQRGDDVRHLPHVKCTFDYECDGEYVCEKFSCKNNISKKPHLTGEQGRCDGDSAKCPDGFECVRSTCYAQ